MKKGKVYLVGAGPGDPDLLTLRAVNLLKKADIVLYDRLVNRAILDFAPIWAERIYVGKSPSDDSSQRQERIYTLMKGHLLAGKTVVRLKGGDPFVFGRGGEEALRLAEMGVRAEIVPGISSCIAAPEAAAIPVTFRGISASFGVFAGQPGDGIKTGQIDWIAASRIGTAVFLMGVARLPMIVAKLLEHGRPADTPIALIEKASLPEQMITIGTLGDILSKVDGAKSPTTVVVGEVVAVREAMEGALFCAAQGQKMQTAS